MSKEAVMFEHMIAEVIKMDTRTIYRDEDGIDSSMRPIQFRPSLLDRVLPRIGDAMIKVGLKLKYRPDASLNTEQASAPNFLIML
jgi:hypothetical protein